MWRYPSFGVRTDKNGRFAVSSFTKLVGEIDGEAGGQIELGDVVDQLQLPGALMTIRDSPPLNQPITGPLASVLNSPALAPAAPNQPARKQ